MAFPLTKIHAFFSIVLTPKILPLISFPGASLSVASPFWLPIYDENCAREESLEREDDVDVDVEADVEVDDEVDQNGKKEHFFHHFFLAGHALKATT